MTEQQNFELEHELDKNDYFFEDLSTRVIWYDDFESDTESDIKSDRSAFFS